MADQTTAPPDQATSQTFQIPVENPEPQQHVHQGRRFKIPIEGKSFKIPIEQPQPEDKRGVSYLTRNDKKNEKGEYEGTYAMTHRDEKGNKSVIPVPFSKVMDSSLDFANKHDAAQFQRDYAAKPYKYEPYKPPAQPQIDTTETMAVQNPKGLVEPGNLPIWSRPSIQNADGSHSSELSISIGTDKGEVLIPTIVGGKFLTPDGKMPPLPKDGKIPGPGDPNAPQAWKNLYENAKKHYRETGEHLGIFDNSDDADAYADALHNRGTKPEQPKIHEPGWWATTKVLGKSAIDAVFGGGYSQVVPLVGATEIAQGMAEHQAQLGDPNAQSALALEEFAATPRVNLSGSKIFQSAFDPRSTSRVSRFVTGTTKSIESLSSLDNLYALGSIYTMPEFIAKPMGLKFQADLVSGGVQQVAAAGQQTVTGDHGAGAEAWGNVFGNVLTVVAMHYGEKGAHEAWDKFKNRDTTETLNQHAQDAYQKPFAKLTDQQKASVMYEAVEDADPRFKARVDREVQRLNAKRKTANKLRVETVRRAAEKGVEEVESTPEQDRQDRLQAAQTLTRQIAVRRIREEAVRKANEQREAEVRVAESNRRWDEYAESRRRRLEYAERVTAESAQSDEQRRGFPAEESRTRAGQVRGLLETTEREPGERYLPEPSEPVYPVAERRAAAGPIPEKTAATVAAEARVQELTEARIGVSFSALPLARQMVSALYLEKFHPEDWKAFQGTPAYATFQNHVESAALVDAALKHYATRHMEGTPEVVNPNADVQAAVARLILARTDVNASLKADPATYRDLNAFTEENTGRSFDSLDEWQRWPALSEYLRNRPEAIHAFLTPDLAERLQAGQHIELANIEAELAERQMIQMQMAERDTVRRQMDASIADQAVRKALKDRNADIVEEVRSTAQDLTRLASDLGMGAVDSVDDLFRIESAIRDTPDHLRTPAMRDVLTRFARVRMAAEDHALRRLAEETAASLRSEDPVGARTKAVRSALELSSHAFDLQDQADALRARGEAEAAAQAQVAATSLKAKVDAIETGVQEVDNPAPAAPARFSGRMLMGRETRVVTPRNEEGRPAHYVIVEADDTVASHNPFSWEETPGYDQNGQPRKYHADDEKPARLAAGTRAQKLDLDILLATGVQTMDGPSVADQRMHIISGNGRDFSLSIARREVPEQWARYQQELADRAASFGIDPVQLATFKNPKLIKVLDQPIADSHEWAMLGKDMNDTPSHGMNVTNLGFIQAQIMSGEALNRLGEIIDSLPLVDEKGKAITVREAMRARSNEIAKLLIQTEVIAPNQISAFIENGELNERAKDMFESMMAGVTVTSANVLKDAPASIKDKLTRAGIFFLKARTAGENWDLTSMNTDAVRLITRALDAKARLENMIGVTEAAKQLKRTDMFPERVAALKKVVGKDESVLEKFLHPERYLDADGMFSFDGQSLHPPVHAGVEALALALEQSPREYAAMLARYANRSAGSQSSMFGAEHPADAFTNEIASKFDLKVIPEEWGMVTGLSEGVKQAIEDSRGPLPVEPETHAANVTADVTPDSSSVTEVLPEGPKNVQELRKALQTHPGYSAEEADAVLTVFESILPKAMGESLNDLLGNRRLTLAFGGKEKTPTGAEVRGYHQILADGSTMIRLCDSANPSTFLHEMAHMIRRYLNPGDQAVANGFVGAKPGAEWTVDQEEKFAEAFERYHHDGGIRRGNLEKVFAVIQRAIQSIYNAAQVLGLAKGTPELNKMFDTWYDWSRAERKPITARVDVDALVDAAQGKWPENLKSVEFSAKQIRGQAQRMTFVDQEAALEYVKNDRNGVKAWRMYKEPGKDTIYAMVEGKKKKLYQTLHAEDEKFESDPEKQAWLRRMNELHAQFREEQLQPQRDAEAQARRELGPDAAPSAVSDRIAQILGQPSLAEALERLRNAPEPNPGAEVRRFGMTVSEMRRRAAFKDWAKQKGITIPEFPKSGTQRRLFQADDVMTLARRARDLEAQLKKTTDPREQARLRGALNGIEDKLRGSAMIIGGGRPAPRDGSIINLVHGLSEQPSEAAPTTPAQAATVQQTAGDPTGITTGGERVEPKRKATAGAGGVREPGRTGKVDEQPGKTDREHAAGKPSAPIVEPAKDPLAKVKAAKLAAPTRERGTPVVSPEKWREHVEALGLPTGTPPPTVRLDPDIRNIMIYPGQAEAVEGALSALQQHDGTILAGPTGSGKTYMLSAIAERLLGTSGDKVGLVVTSSRPLIHEADGYVETARKLGVDVTDLPQNMAEMTTGMYAATYAQIRGNRDVLTVPWDFVLFDESSWARNWTESEQGKAVALLGHAAKKVVYSSATPYHTVMEIGYMHKLGLWPKGGFAEWAAQFGLREVGPNTFSGGTSAKRLEKLRQQLIERGQWQTLYKDMDGVEAHVTVVPQTAEVKAGIRSIRAAFAMARAAFQRARMSRYITPAAGHEAIYLKRYIESQRLPETIKLTRNLIRAGWHPIVFSEYRSGADDGMDFFHHLPGDLGKKINAMLPPLPNVVEEMRKAFGSDMAIFAGEANQVRASELEGFQSGEKKAVYMTFAAGGVGANAQDKVGEDPRAVVFMGLPWSGIMFEQGTGRPWRYNTKSGVLNIFLTSDTLPEMKVLATKILPRMRSLKAAVYGEKMESSLSKAMRESVGIPEEILQYEHGEEVSPEAAEFEQTAEGVNYAKLADFEIPDANKVKNKGMKYKGVGRKLYQAVREVPNSETEEFKKWFEGSKVVDADGKPLKVYHGTKMQMDEIQPNRGITYFAANPEYANYFAGVYRSGADKRIVALPGGRVFPVYLRMTHPFDARRIGMDVITSEDYANMVGMRPQDVQNVSGIEKTRFWNWLASNKQATHDALAGQGYDGIIHKEENYSGYDENDKPVPVATDAYVAFTSDQIKPAMGRRLYQQNRDVPLRRENPYRDALRKAREEYSATKPETVKAYEEALRNYELSTSVGMRQLLHEQMGQMQTPGDVADVDELERMYKRLYQADKGEPEDPFKRLAHEAWEGMLERTRSAPAPAERILTANEPIIKSDLARTARKAMGSGEKVEDAVERRMRDLENDALIWYDDMKQNGRAASHLLKSSMWLFGASGDRAVAKFVADAGFPKQGEELQRRMIEYDLLSGNYRGEFGGMVAKIIDGNKLSQKDLEMVSKVVEGQASSTNPRINKAVGEFRKFTSYVRRRLAASGLSVVFYNDKGQRAEVPYSTIEDDPNYWPRIYNWYEKFVITNDDGTKTVTSLGDIMNMPTGSQRREALIEKYAEQRGISKIKAQLFFDKNARGIRLAGNIERAREYEIPMYGRDRKALDRYVNEVAEKLASAEVHGQFREKTDPIIDAIPNEETRRVVNHIVTADLDPGSLHDADRLLLKAVNGWEIVSKMSLSAMKLPFHIAKTALATNTRSVVGAVLKEASSPLEVRRNAADAGALTDYIRAAWMREYGLNPTGPAQRLLDFNGFTLLMRESRVLAAAAGRLFFEKYAYPELKKNPADARLRHKLKDLYGFSDEHLDRMIQNGYGPADVKRMELGAANWTTGSGRPSELPPAARNTPEDSPIFKRLTTIMRVGQSLHGFMFKTANLVNRTVWQELLHSDFRTAAPYRLIARFGVNFGMAGWALQELLHLRHQLTHSPEADIEKRRKEWIEAHPLSSEHLFSALSNISMGMGIEVLTQLFDELATHDPKDKAKLVQQNRVLNSALQTVVGVAGMDFYNIGKAVADYSQTFTDTGKHHQSPEERRQNVLERLANEEVPLSRTVIHPTKVQPASRYPHRHGRHTSVLTTR